MVDENELLMPIDQYLKAGIHIGTKFKTKHMQNFIYKSRPDGLYVLNLQKIDERLRICGNFLSKYKPEEILVVSRRENGWRPVKLFSKLVGCKYFAGRYPPGILTNKELKDFLEVKVVLVTDAWPDRNAIQDAIKSGNPIIGLCDTNNKSNYLDLVVPCNNKGRKALGLVFYILAREYLRNTGVLASNEELSRSVDQFVEE